MSHHFRSGDLVALRPWLASFHRRGQVSTVSSQDCIYVRQDGLTSVGIFKAADLLYLGLPDIDQPPPLEVLTRYFLPDGTELNIMAPQVGDLIVVRNRDRDGWPIKGADPFKEIDRVSAVKDFDPENEVWGVVGQPGLPLPVFVHVCRLNVPGAPSGVWIIV